MSIEVHVRVRPGVANPVWSSAETVLYSTANTNTRYIYNKVHPSNTGNLTIFQGIEAIVHAAFDGRNVTVMAYGQTGSGKTYSMTGTEADHGIVPRTAKLLLELKKIHPGTTVHAYYTEIYNESVKDLLEPQRGELALHDAPDGGVTFEKRMVQVDSFEDFLRLQSAAERNRKYGVTNLNDHSSRSHIILTFEIHRAHRTQRSVINLVDLAGSESAARANTEGATLREGGFINRSLLTLGNVVDAIVEKRSYIPYRDAKLTRILRNCLGGTGITFILCCINPSRENYEQTITTLRFTQRAMKIKKDPVVVLNMPPLFVHQYAAGAKQLISGLQESAEAEYQRGIRDAYMFCNNTAGSVVTNFQSQVADSMHALANAQRLLIAHDHAMGMDRVGRLYNQLNELTRQRVKSHDLLEGERKRQREIAEEIAQRKAKRQRLEGELSEKETAADTDLAGWEYQLHEARQRQVREVDVLLRTEEARRARIGYEWAVCVERIAARYVPILASTLSSAAKLPPDQEQQHRENGGAGRGSDVAALDGGPAAVSRGASKAVLCAELRERLRRARAELADLVLAHDMVREDVELARRRQAESGGGSSSMTAGVHAKLAQGVSNAELAEQIELLEQEERQLQAQAKRNIRRESLRRVRESLRRASHSPQTGSHGQGHTPQTERFTGEGHGRDGKTSTVLFRGSDDDGPDGDEEDMEGGPQHHSQQPTSSSATHRRAVGAGGGRGGNRTRSRCRSGSRSNNPRSANSHSAAARDSYADGVRNALSVIDSLRSQLRLPQRAGDAPQARRRGTPPPRAHADPTREDEGAADDEPTFLDMFGGRSGSPRRRDAEKENFFGYESRPGQSIRFGGKPSTVTSGASSSGGGGGGAGAGAARGQGHLGKMSPCGSANNRHARQKDRYRDKLEMIAEDDEAFGSASPDKDHPHRAPPPQQQQPSPGDVTPPIVGIAARRKWDRQTSHSGSIPPGQRVEVERALYPLHGNSQSAERRSHSRRGY